MPTLTPTPQAIEVCTHPSYTMHPSDPEGGYPTKWAECSECSDVTFDFEDDEDERGKWTAPTWVTSVKAPGGFYIVITRLNYETYPAVIIGQFPTQEAAEDYLQNAIQVDAIVEDDCDDAYWTDAEGAEEAVRWHEDEELPWELHGIVIETEDGK